MYYKVPPERLAEITVAVQLLFQTAKQKFSVHGRWMRRRDDPTTYMEVYEDVQDTAAFEAALAREGERLGLARKLERFVCA